MKYKNIREGEQLHFDLHFLNRIKKQFPGIKAISPEITGPYSQVMNKAKSGLFKIIGINENYMGIKILKINEDGRYFNKGDDENTRNVTIIGENVSTTLFNNQKALGKSINIAGIDFKVIGVLKNDDIFSASEINSVYVPFSSYINCIDNKTPLRAFCLYLNKEVDSKRFENELRAFIANKYQFAYSDKQALQIINFETQTSAFEGLFDGLKMFIWIVGILLIHPKLDEMKAKGMFVKASETEEPGIGTWWGGKGMFVDFTSQETRNNWKEMLKENVLDYGTSSIWNDNCEYDSMVDKDCRCSFEGKGGTIGQLKSVMSNIMCHITNEAIHETFDNTRPYVVCRSGHAGIQRYAQTWAGDNLTCWESLKYNIATILGMGLSGVANQGCDIGGFYGPAPEAELLVRWIQNGIFQPRFSIHSTNIDNTVTEPWMYSNCTEYIRTAIKLRYRLFPYLYSLLENVDHTNEHFSMNPKDQLAAVKDMRANKLVPLGNWHSHPESPSRPSEEDKRLAYDPTVNYLILSLMDMDQPVLKAFDIDKEKNVTIEELVIQ